MKTYCEGWGTNVRYKLDVKAMLEDMGPWPKLLLVTVGGCFDGTEGKNSNYAHYNLRLNLSNVIGNWASVAMSLGSEVVAGSAVVVGNDCTVTLKSGAKCKKYFKQQRCECKLTLKCDVTF